MICILLGWICFRIFSATLSEAFVCGLGFVKKIMKGTQGKYFTFCQWELNKILSHNQQFCGCFILWLVVFLFLSPTCCCPEMFGFVNPIFFNFLANTCN